MENQNTNTPGPEARDTAPPAESSPGFAFASAGQPIPKPKIATYVTVTSGYENHPDAQASKQLLDRCITADGFKCIRCEFTTSSLEEMAHHLADEINNTMRQLQNYFDKENQKQRKSQPETAQRFNKPSEGK